MIDRPPSARCTRCGMPGPETRINERCSNTLNGKRCKGTFRSALNEGDWSICSACGGSRILEGRGCQYCHGSFGRILCLDTAVDNKYALGLFVTIKDQKRFCEIREQSGQFQLVTRDLDDDARMADFNFFLLNKTSHRGIYQYYHQSCSLQQFLSFLISQFNSSKKDRIDEIRSADEALDTEATVTSIKETKLTTQILVKQESFEELIDEFRRIKELKFEFVTYDADSSIFRPIRDVMKKRTERVLFERDTSLLHQIGQGIKELVRSGEIKDVKVKGLAADSGVEMTIALLNNVEDFGRYDYNSLTEGLTVDFNGFARSAILSLLRQVAEEHDYMIGATNAG